MESFFYVKHPFNKSIQLETQSLESNISKMDVNFYQQIFNRISYDQQYLKKKIKPNTKLSNLVGNKISFLREQISKSLHSINISEVFQFIQ